MAAGGLAPPFPSRWCSAEASSCLTPAGGCGEEAWRLLGCCAEGDVRCCSGRPKRLFRTEEPVLTNATQRRQQLVQGLADLAKRYPITDVRVRGLMVAAKLGGSDEA
eukprot:jgi/Chlat1/5620/Chrsp369S05409